VRSSSWRTCSRTGQMSTHWTPAARNAVSFSAIGFRRRPPSAGCWTSPRLRVIFPRVAPRARTSPDRERHSRQHSPGGIDLLADGDHRACPRTRAGTRWRVSHKRPDEGARTERHARTRADSCRARTRTGVPCRRARRAHTCRSVRVDFRPRASFWRDVRCCGGVRGSAVLAPREASPDRAGEVNVLGLDSEQIGVNRLSQAAPLSQIEANC
jgi:hypothetical protein